jgi:hypothetical protein
MCILLGLFGVPGCCPAKRKSEYVVESVYEYETENPKF